MTPNPFAQKRLQVSAACLFWLFAGFCCFSLVSKAQTPDPKLPVANGAIYAIASDASYTYIGGAFSELEANTGGEALLTTSSAVRNANFPFVTGRVRCSVPDGSGGWYIGGDFTKVGALIRSNLAHVLSDGTVDASWDPNADDIVETVAIMGTDVYVGGRFTTIGGQARTYIAKLNNTNGAADLGWNTNASNNIYTIKLSGTDVYVGGEFTTIGAQSRNRLAKLNNTTGGADASWNPNVNDRVQCMVIDGADMYIGGGFNAVGVSPKSRLAKLNLTTGVVDPAWTADANNFVRTIAISGADMYVGGEFTTIGGQTRNRVAKLNKANGTVAAWDALATGNAVYVVAVSGSDVYVGGDFTNIGGQSRNYIARLNNTTGVADVSWNPNANLNVLCITISGADVYVGGDFTLINRLTRNNIARVDNTTGIVDAGWNPNASSEVTTIAVSGTDIYVGGDFLNIGGLTRNRIAKLNNTTGAADAGWVANADNEILSIAVSGSGVFAAGFFYTIGGQQRTYIAKLSGTTGAVDQGWNANINGLQLYSIALSGVDLYVGGYFSNAGGLSRNNIAKLNTTTGAGDASWDADANDVILSLAVSGADVYAGGDFNSIGGVARNKIAKLNNTTGAADPAWDANANNTVFSLAVNGQDVYAGGDFTAIGGQTRNRIAKLNTTTGGAKVSWHPDVNSTVLCLAPQGQYIYAGGYFNLVNSRDQQSLARFDTTASPYTWTGAVSNDCNTAGNWDANSLPGSTNTVIIPAATTNAPNLNNGNFTVKNFTQNSGQTLTLGTGNITVTGAFTNNGTITGTGKVVLNGVTAQSITGTGSVGNIELNNSTGATITAGANKLNITGLASLTAGTLTTNDNLVLKSTGPTATAMVGPITGGISGNVTHERYLSAPANGSSGRSWRLLTSPIGNNATNNSIFYNWQNNGVNDGTGIELWSSTGTGAAGNGLALGSSASIRSFDYLTNTYVPVTNTKTTTLFTGTRNNTFMAFVSGSYGSGNIGSGSAATNADATGSLITGTQNYSFTTVSAANKYYLMGNPYACPVDFDKVYHNPATANINQKFWVIDPNLGNLGAYATVTWVVSSYVTSAGTQNQYIQTGQGFFVEAATPNVTSVVSIEENDKETSAAQTAQFRTNGGALETFRAKPYKNGTLLDGAVVASHQTASNVVDGVDGLKFNNFNENIGILTAGKVLGIDARQLLDNNDTVNVTLSSMQQTNYQLELEPGNMSASGLTATLIDNFTNTTTPVSLNSNTTYSFTVTASAASTGTGRFKVVFNTIAPLELRFVATSAIKHNDKIDVQWTVSNQNGIRSYEVERSNDARSFRTIATVAAGAENMYDIADEAPTGGNNYYRLKAIARSNDHGVYSNVVRLNTNDINAQVSVYPNPVKDGHLQINIAGLSKGNYTISLYNAAGQKAATKQLPYDAGSMTIDMNVTSLPAGIYMMQLINDNGEAIAEQKIVKQ